MRRRRTAWVLTVCDNALNAVKHKLALLEEAKVAKKLWVKLHHMQSLAKLLPADVLPLLSEHVCCGLNSVQIRLLSWGVSASTAGALRHAAWPLHEQAQTCSRMIQQ